MNRSEAGKLGYKKSKSKLIAHSQEQSTKARANFESLNVRCKQCGEKIPYEKRDNKFCNQSCGGFFNNKNRKVVKRCVFCNNPLNTGRKYCSSACQQNHRWAERIIAFETAGKVPNPQIGKRYLLRTLGRVCSLCRNTTWMNKPIPLILDHINGYHDDNRISNLR